MWVLSRRDRFRGVRSLIKRLLWACAVTACQPFSLMKWLLSSFLTWSRCPSLAAESALPRAAVLPASGRPPRGTYAGWTPAPPFPPSERSADLRGARAEALELHSRTRLEDARPEPFLSHRYSYAGQRRTASMHTGAVRLSSRAKNAPAGTLRGRGSSVGRGGVRRWWWGRWRPWALWNHLQGKRKMSLLLQPLKPESGCLLSLADSQETSDLTLSAKLGNSLFRDDNLLSSHENALGDQHSTHTHWCGSPRQGCGRRTARRGRVAGPLWSHIPDTWVSSGPRCLSADQTHLWHSYCWHGRSKVKISIFTESGGDDNPWRTSIDKDGSQC